MSIRRQTVPSPPPEAEGKRNQPLHLPRSSKERGAGGEVNPFAWLLWLGGVTIIPLTSRNPLYLVLDLLVVLVVYLSLPRRSGAARAWRLFATIGSTLAVFSIGFNVLTVHVGDQTFARLPNELPIIGGQLTWNAFVYGVISALAIITLLVGAAVFNTAIRHSDMIRLMPDRFANLGIAGSIAMTMVPATMTAARDIYDAQRSRGYRIHGVRDARGVIVPLLGTSLERALVLSEALEARGFGNSAALPDHSHLLTRFIPVASAMLLLGSLALLGWGFLTLGFVTLVAAVALLMATGTQSGSRTRYRPFIWNRSSILVAVAAGSCLLTIMLLTLLTSTTLAYDPFPRLIAPEFNPLIGVAILLLLSPVVRAEL